MKKKLIFILSISALVLVFQNCAEYQPQVFPSRSSSPSKSLTEGGLASLSQGKVQGQIQNSSSGEEVFVFKGIPFAQPPVGNLRWAPPQSPEDWSETLQASSFKEACMQEVSSNFPLSAEVSEDCLYLNLWVPKKQSEKLPVLVWIYGGAFTKGAASQSFYDALELAAQGELIVLSFNYRVGPLGFFAHAGQNQNAPRGNYGLMDQVKVLEWVQNHIGAFGGDSNNVTLFGESAGAMSVAYHMISPLSRGLFHKGLLQSGPIFSDLLKLKSSDANEDTGEKRAATLAQALSCNRANLQEELSCLKSASAASIVQNQSSSVSIQTLSVGGVMLDQHTLVQDVRAALESPSYQGLPVLIGSNSDESKTLVDPPFATKNLWDLFLLARYGAQAPQVSSFFNVTQDSQVAEAWDELISLKFFKAQARLFAAKNQQKGGRSWLYYFERVGPGALLSGRGAAHSFEIPYFFKTLSKAPSGFYNSADQSLSSHMSSYLIRFAHAGNPNAQGSFNWPELLPGSDASIIFNENLGTEVDHFQPELDFFETTF